MEPEGDSLSPRDSFTPVTSYGPPPSFSTQDTTTNTFLNSTLQVSDKLTLSGSLWSRGGDGDFERSEGPLSWVEPGRSAQRSFRPSAFPSSLTWDSDSEKETLDEEELQHFSNPHGLAAHSPGSPSSGLRPESEDDQAPEQLQPLLTETNVQSPAERHNQEQTSAHSGEPNEAQPSSTELLDNRVWNVSEKAELSQSKVKPKEGCHVKEEREEEDVPDIDKEFERDVYTFPGDSDPDSPPPAPWAHCTFIQRRRKKRALLRPFSGQGAWECTSGAGRKARGACPKAGSVGTVKVSGGVYDFKEEEEAAEKLEKVEDGRGTVEGGVGELGQEIYTCVECSIYFKKQVYLQEHMEEHSLSNLGGGRRERGGKGGRFRCVECGWNLPNRLALADHHRRHQESRQKIVEEIGKLSSGGKAENMLGEQMKVTEPACPVQHPLVAPVTITVPDSVPVPVRASVKARVKTPVKAKVKVPASRRFLCLKCDFSTRTSQALANHAKTHNRKTTGLQRASPRFQPKLTLVEPPGSSPGGASTSLTCDQCAFQASSQIALKKHQHLAHSAQTSISGDRPEEMGYPRSSVDSSSTPSCENVSKHVPQTEGQSQSKACKSSASNWVPAVEDSGTQSQPTNGAAAPQCREVAFKTIGNKRTNRRGRVGTELLRPNPRLDCRPSDSQDAQSQSHSNDLATEMTRKEMVGSKPLTRARSIRGLVEVPALAMQLKRAFTASLRGAAEHLGLTEGQQAHLRHSLPLVLTEPLRFDCQTPLSYLGCWERGKAMEDSSLKQQSLVTCYSEGKPAKEEEDEEPKEEEDEKPKAVFKKKSNKVFAAENDDDVNHDDHNDDEEEEEEKIRRFLAEGVSDEDYEEMDDETGTLKRVERKCPYCPDRFHNGIGLANHVRGHLNRVGVSYNVRHFISPEEVNAIEKKFSYQKKKKKVANFDPDTFSVMRCEFCSAGFDTRAGLSSHARAHLRDFGITNWEVTVSPIHILRELFSSRPDLVLPMAPPHNPASDEEEEEEDEDPETDKEEPGGVEESEEATGASVSNLPSSSPCQPWKKESSVSEPEGGEDEEQMPVLDSLTSSPVSNLLKCEVCSAPFETRRGLSSHARSHLRQLGIGMSESSGAPIDLLYQITKERSLDGHFPPPSPRSPATKNTPHSSPTPQEESYDDTDVDEKPIRLSVLAKAVKVPTSSTPSPVASPAPSSIIRSCSPSPVVRKAPISSLLPVSSPLRCLDHKPGGMKSTGSNLSAKPFWAPQDTDAPLNLTLEVDPNKDIVCQLCGAWFETRKGLSSHARAHLRHFGVEYSESKGSPIDLLNQLIHTDDFKHRASALQPDGLRGHAAGLSSPKRSHHTSTSPHYKGSTTGDRPGSKATSASGSSVFGPPPKRPKSSQLQVFRLSGGELLPIPHSEPVKEIGCEFCGEYFENRKGLSSHARSHLRQMGITEWSVNGSPIDTLRELITRRGLPCALPLKPLKSPPPSPGPPRSPMSSSSSPSLLSRLPFAFAHPPSRQSTVRKMGPAPSSSAGLIVKLKPEPMQLEISMPAVVGGAYASEPLNCSWSGSDNMLPLNLVTAHETEPTRDIRCEFCGEYFENRKGLSSHARSHLRQMGITEWSVNGSPIDTLRELMHKRGGASSPGPGVKKESSQRSSPTWECLVGGLGYQSPKLSRKSPLNLLHSGSRLHKHGLGAVGLSSTPPAGKFFAVSPLGKRSLSEEGRTLGRSSPHPQPKTFSPAPHDLSFKGKSSPEKNATGHLDASCELCGFYFENRKALASHARAHLRQFGVTEWCVNGSPIETLSAWMRSRPHKVVEMHRSYMQGSARSTPKKKSCSSPSSDSDPPPPLPSQKPSSSQWAALGLAQARRVGRELTVASPRTAEGDAVATPPSRLSHSSPSPAHLSNALSPHAQVARSELNVRLPRGFERRPPKHPSHSEGGERDSGSPKPPRTSTIPALVPKPPCTPLVKVVGKIYNLKCRFCEVEFQGPLSVQEDWIRHLQQHILNLNYNKPAPSATGQPAQGPNPTPGPAATRSFTPTPDPTSTPPPIHTTAPTVPTPASPAPSPVAAPVVTATPMATASTEPTPTPIPVATPAL